MVASRRLRTDEGSPQIRVNEEQGSTATNASDAVSLTADTDSGPSTKQGQRAKRWKSCAECRRLKLRCSRDRVDMWPCVPCQQRHCADLCPGETTGLSNKAATEKLLRHYRRSIRNLESQVAARDKATSGTEEGEVRHANSIMQTRESVGSTITMDESTHRSRSTQSRSETTAQAAHTVPESSIRPMPTYDSSSILLANAFPDVPPEKSYREERPSDVLSDPRTSTMMQPPYLSSLTMREHSNPYASIGEGDGNPLQSPFLRPPQRTSIGSWNQSGQGASLDDHTSAFSQRTSATPTDETNVEEQFLPSPNDKANTYHGRSAGPLFAHLCMSSGDADNQKGSPNKYAAVRNDLLRDYARQHVLPGRYEESLVLLQLYEQCVTWLYSPIEVDSIWSILEATYSQSKSVTRDRLLLLCFALALGAKFGVASSSDTDLDWMHEKASRIPTTSMMTIMSKLRATSDDIAMRIFAFAYNSFLDPDLSVGLLATPTLEKACSAHLCTSFLLSFGESSKSNMAWQILGLGIRMSVAQGLHRRQPRTGSLSNDHRQEVCSRVFWELVLYERLQSLNFGRPALLPTNIGCPKPFKRPGHDLMNAMPDSTLFHSIKYDLCELYGEINDLMSKEDVPEHTMVMDLDHRVRRFYATIPSFLQYERPLPSLDFTTKRVIQSQRHMLHLLIHKALLFLHRPYYIRAVRAPSEPMLSSASASFAAAFASARQHTVLFQSGLIDCAHIMNWWFFVFHLYTAAIIQAQICLHHPGCILAEQALSNFRISLRLLEQRSSLSALAKRSYKLLLSFERRIKSVMGKAASIQPASIRFSRGDDRQAFAPLNDLWANMTDAERNDYKTVERTDREEHLAERFAAVDSNRMLGGLWSSPNSVEGRRDTFSYGLHLGGQHNTEKHSDVEHLTQSTIARALWGEVSSCSSAEKLSSNTPFTGPSMDAALVEQGSVSSPTTAHSAIPMLDDFINTGTSKVDATVDPLLQALAFWYESQYESQPQPN